VQDSGQFTSVVEQLKYDNERLKLALTQRLQLLVLYHRSLTPDPLCLNFLIHSSVDND